MHKISKFMVENSRIYSRNKDHFVPSRTAPSVLEVLKILKRENVENAFESHFSFFMDLKLAIVWARSAFNVLLVVFNNLNLFKHLINKIPFLLPFLKFARKDETTNNPEVVGIPHL